MKKFLIITYLILGLFLTVNNPVFANSDMEKIRVMSEIGTLVNAENYNIALDKCYTALKKYPDEADLYYWIASIKSNMGDEKGAITDYDKAISLNPDDPGIYVMRGISKSNLGDNTGAIEDYNHALKINPHDSSAYSMRACSKIALGDLTGANEDLEMANKLFDEEEQTLTKP